jgi:hypothetical protein
VAFFPATLRSQKTPAVGESRTESGARSAHKTGMLRLLIVFSLVAGACCAFSDVMPLTAKEISLMLRSGYSSEAVLRELSTRHFAELFDPTIQKELVRAGANQALIDALQSGTYQLSAPEIAAAKEKLAAQEEQASMAAEEQAASDPSGLGQSTPGPANSSQAPLPSDTIYRLLKDDLVYLQEGSLTHFDDEALEHKKLFLFFFSAFWSTPGRKFTPQLVEYYNRVVQEHPDFEVVFFSVDRSQFAMETYMTQSRMPWPAVEYDKIATKGPATKLVHGVPCLMLVDASGNVLFNSYGGEKDLGVEKALAETDKALARGGSDGVAQGH